MNFPKQMFKGLFIFLLAVALVGCGVKGMENYNAGVQYQQAGQVDLAEQQYKIAIQQNPELGEAYLNLGLIYINKQWFDGALQNTQKAIEIFNRTKNTYIEGSSLIQTLAIAYNNLGIIEMNLIEQAGANISMDDLNAKWDSAISHFQSAINLDPQCAEANSNLSKFTNARAEYVQMLKYQKLSEAYLESLF